MKEVADIVPAEITSEQVGEVHRRLPLPDVRQIAQTCRQFVRIPWPAAARRGHDIEDWRCAEQEQMLHYA